MPEQDPYHLLGISRSASEAEIKSAYRKLAKKLHPDVNPGRKDIEQKFKELTAAYDLLSDPVKRARFDRGEIDAQGHERGFHRSSYRSSDPFSGMGGGRRRQESSFNFGGGFSPEDFFSEFFGGGQGKASPPPKGADVSYEIDVGFTEACLGARKRITLPNKKTLEINIPPGTEEGHKLRLRGMGHQGKGDSGDALITIHVLPHPDFKRQGQDIHLEVPVSLNEALLGASITIPTLEGSVHIKIPKGANTGTTLRLKGKGVPSPKAEKGDMFAVLQIVLPSPPQEELTHLIEKWAKKHTYDPRAKKGWS